MRSAQPPVWVRGRVALTSFADPRNHGQRYEEPEPVVVDLAVAHRDDHPLGEQQKHRGAEKARVQPRRGDRSEDDQRPEQCVNQARRRDRQMQEVCDVQRSVQVARCAGVAVHPIREQGDVGEHVDVTECAKRSYAAVGDGCGDPVECTSAPPRFCIGFRHHADVSPRSQDVGLSEPSVGGGGSPAYQLAANIVSHSPVS